MVFGRVYLTATQISALLHFHVTPTPLLKNINKNSLRLSFFNVKEIQAAADTRILTHMFKEFQPSSFLHLNDDRILSWKNYKRRKVMLFKQFLLCFYDDDKLSALESDKNTQLKFPKYVGIRLGQKHNIYQW